MTDFWVRSATMPDGRYGVSIELGPDRAYTLDRTAALKYAAACCYEATAAEHSAAVLRLFTEKLDIPREEAAAFVRRDLAPHPSTARAPAPVRFIATVGRAKHPRPDAGKTIGLVRIEHDGIEQGWVSPEELRDHATGVLSALAATELDTRLMQALVEVIDLDEASARAMVHQLGDFMPGRNAE
ncbi:hypothetical protein [Nocardia asiatica]|uniref:hypothetical protein n=1 Tax=Nocardia asiatica TaxID=209252 RepID=UPI002456A23E|nr:hypothetical protein [Nocardia asiatica]